MSCCNKKPAEPQPSASAPRGPRSAAWKDRPYPSAKRGGGQVREIQRNDEAGWAYIEVRDSDGRVHRKYVNPERKRQVSQSEKAVAARQRIAELGKANKGKTREEIFGKRK